MILVAINVAGSTKDPEVKEPLYMEAQYGPTEPLETLAGRIRKCESGDKQFNNDGTIRCNAQFGCRGGIGVYQLLESTAELCSIGLERSIDPYAEQDNRDCGMWLLQTDGPRHWGTETSWWGSYHCWNK